MAGNPYHDEDGKFTSKGNEGVSGGGNKPNQKPSHDTEGEFTEHKKSSNDPLMNLMNSLMDSVNRLYPNKGSKKEDRFSHNPAYDKKEGFVPLDEFLEKPEPKPFHDTEGKFTEHKLADMGFGEDSVPQGNELGSFNNPEKISKKEFKKLQDEGRIGEPIDENEEANGKLANMGFGPDKKDEDSQVLAELEKMAKISPSDDSLSKRLKMRDAMEEYRSLNGTNSISQKLEDEIYRKYPGLF